MGLDTVEEDIREEARAEAAEIREAAEERAATILEEARVDADATREAAHQAAEDQIQQERERAISSAKLEAKQQLLQARRNVLEEVRGTVEEELAAMEGDRRRELTELLLDAATEEFEDDAHLEVYTRPVDADLVEELLADREGVERGGDVECLGGVLVEGGGGSVRVDNTFDSILDEVWEDRLKDISDQLFEE